MTAATQKANTHKLDAKSVGLVFCCTLLGAAAQIFMKLGANRLAKPSLWQMITNLPLMTGYCFYGMSTMLLVLALRKAHLSVLYPIISLTYVWVTLLSMVIFHEQMNLYKGIGLTVIVFGVAVLGFGDRK
jgi:multidrug transporter EmrE-like cation transporter